jgi:hypothetical protein
MFPPLLACCLSRLSFRACSASHRMVDELFLSQTSPHICDHWKDRLYIQALTSRGFRVDPLVCGCHMIAIPLSGDSRTSRDIRRFEVYVTVRYQEEALSVYVFSTRIKHESIVDMLRGYCVGFAYVWNIHGPKPAPFAILNKTTVQRSKQALNEHPIRKIIRQARCTFALV